LAYIIEKSLHLKRINLNYIKMFDKILVIEDLFDLMFLDPGFYTL